MELKPGVAFGRYTIDAELGRGGMGRVMLATDGVLHRKVALKVVLPGLEEREEIVHRFFREARLAAQLTHPNTVHVYDLGEVHGHLFLAMEYVDGQPLSAYLGDASVPAERRMGWLIDVAKGLGAAHARGLLHRDMKPANVMVSKDGVAKVVDFGLAKRESRRISVSDQLSSTERHATFQTALGFVVGTPAYMAPEQLEGADTVDARADQFAWALTAYALLLGKNLRKDDPLLFGPIPLLSDRVPGISRRAAEIILRALSNDREMRFPSMDILAADLELAVKGRPSVSSRVSSRESASIESAPRPSAVRGPASASRTPVMGAAPAARQAPGRFCAECGLSLAMPSPRCKAPHVEAFPKPPGIKDD